MAIDCYEKEIALLAKINIEKFKVKIFRQRYFAINDDFEL